MGLQLGGEDGISWGKVWAHGVSLVQVFHCSGGLLTLGAGACGSFELGLLSNTVSLAMEMGAFICCAVEVPSCREKLFPFFTCGGSFQKSGAQPSASSIMG